MLNQQDNHETPLLSKPTLFHHGELQFRRLLEKLPAGAYTCDPQGLITYYNRHAVQLWGREPRLNHPQDRFCGSFKLYAKDGTPISHDECWMALALKTEAEYNGQEILVERPDGQRLTVLAHANPIYDDSGKLLGAVNVLVDISDRKKAEDAMKKADESKNQFLAMLAHELRNPLAPITNAVEILKQKGAPTPELQLVVNVIDRQMRQMSRLIDDLVDVARITANKLELRSDRIELAELIDVAVQISRPHMDARELQFQIDIPAVPMFLAGDFTRLSQVISNLLNNAAKYTPRGGNVWLAIKAENGNAVISVRDNGIGISSDVISRIFDLFVQANSSSGNSEGLGVGLTLVKRLVEMHGGTVEAYSEGPGKGSEFIIRLPLLTDFQQQSLTSNQIEQAINSPSVLRILVVDDNIIAAEMFRMMLHMKGHEVYLASDGLEAMALAHKHRPHVILLDLCLPKMSGYEVAEAVRKEVWGEGVVLIAITGLGNESEKNRTKEAGFDHHLVKPVQPAELFPLLPILNTAAS